MFPPTQALQMVSAIGIAFSTAFVFAGIWGPASDRALLVVAGLLIFSFVLASWPKTVWISESGLRQRSWSCRWKRIAWPEVSDVKERRDGSVEIRGNGTKIVLSQFHADRRLFLEKIRRMTPSPSTISG
jgi:hypothetical protein